MNMSQVEHKHVWKEGSADHAIFGTWVEGTEENTMCGADS